MNKMSSEGKKDLRKWICERRMNIFWIATVLVFCLTVGTAALEVKAAGVYAEEGKLYEKQERLLAEFRKETKCSAVCAVTYDHGQVTVLGDAEGLWQIGSMTKAFTGLAIQKLIHEGKLSENDVISNLLPGFEAYYEGECVEITIGQLLTQTSGYDNSEKRYPSAVAGQTLMEWVETISGRNLQSAPGEKYAYSNVNFNLLGAVIEQVTGRSYRDYMEQEIIMPLGLEHTYVGEPERADEKKAVVDGTRLLFRKAITHYLPVREGAIPAGYFYSNGTDMALWMEIWLGVADIPLEYQELIRETKEKLVKEGDYYAGWERFENGRIGHSGGTPNYSSRIVFSESENVGACVLTNLNMAASTDSLCNGLLDGMTEVQGKTGKQGMTELIKTDVWTVFDRIFTGLCIAGGIAFLVCIRIRKRGILVVTGITSLVLLTLLVIMLPLIFGVSLLEILLLWAPWSLTVFLGIMAASVACVTLRLVRWRRP